MHWIPKLHKNPYKSRFIANSSKCSTTNLSKHLTSALSCIKEHIYKYCETIRSNSGVNFFWSIKNSGAILDKFSAINHKASSLDVFDFSTLYTSLPHQKIKDQLKDLIKWTFSREDKAFLCTNYVNGFFFK